ncbi:MULTISPECIES: hypothetical protein [Bradyrhizobium]|uniref:hypothetical protein n=1 Tax=Bradyrhizobium TaxID=374 RepID=UPI0012BB67AE|nr:MULTISPECIES: hypothetical protein [Bradyrhizobium]MBR0877767.1 hypothetical protein [Bradyrhizobium liaoningense]MBR0997732.1 hypothetical protein [Bradyrhizobium liaoningense]MBR1066464.1 hypothetical protein [Bradyrhizobium liaoningense]MCP1743595.1 chromosome segregation ATPase [Bradyrhizobium japonicum]MCP1781945.1 chromosome segregation ATPase [Bradyrhizobium japonicum]
MLQQRDQQSAPIEPDPEQLLCEALQAPVPDAIAQWRREGEEFDARCARERRRRERRAEPAPVDVEARIMALVEQRIEALSAEVAGVRNDVHDIAAACSHAVEQINNALDDLSAVARAPAKAIDERIEAMFSQLERKLDEIVPRHAGEVIELPPLPLRGSRAN